MPNKTHRALPRYKISDFFRSLLEQNELPTIEEAIGRGDEIREELQKNGWGRHHPAVAGLNRSAVTCPTINPVPRRTSSPLSLKSSVFTGLRGLVPKYDRIFAYGEPQQPSYFIR
jgi:hypothetical protein